MSGHKTHCMIYLNSSFDAFKNLNKRNEIQECVALKYSRNK